ncbi:EKC/KEOPS complex subunit LAGE3-like [Heterocephalus glaber]|uniref:EKC/KEOPS complex subunit LAGE3-like n=1 Tax=Heterocephalus glaber TaxID=10181 RepID=A0AAX6QSJ5_HETGA|nr:EKC/KEOPS complex subunit LAGE3-like [Heterocephalus glaber]
MESRRGEAEAGGPRAGPRSRAVVRARESRAGRGGGGRSLQRGGLRRPGCGAAAGRGCEGLAGPGARSLQHRALTTLYSSLRVPFPYPGEAEVARGTLTLLREHVDIRREFMVDGSLLTVGWVDPDRDSLQTVFNRFLDDLALLLRTMRCFGPPFPPMSLPDKGG